MPGDPHPTYYGPMVSSAHQCQSDAHRLYGETAVASPWRKAPAVIKKAVQR